MCRGHTAHTTAQGSETKGGAAGEVSERRVESQTRDADRDSGGRRSFHPAVGGRTHSCVKGGTDHRRPGPASNMDHGPDSAVCRCGGQWCLPSRQPMQCQLEPLWLAPVCTPAMTCWERHSSVRRAGSHGSDRSVDMSPPPFHILVS